MGGEKPPDVARGHLGQLLGLCNRCLKPLPAFSDHDIHEEHPQGLWLGDQTWLATALE